MNCGVEFVPVDFAIESYKGTQEKQRNANPDIDVVLETPFWSACVGPIAGEGKTTYPLKGEYSFLENVQIISERIYPF